MSVDTLTADGAPVSLPPPPANTYDHNQFYQGVSYAVVPGTDEVVTVTEGGQQYLPPVYALQGFNLDGTLLFSRELDTSTRTAGVVADGGGTGQFALISSVPGSGSTSGLGGTIDVDLVNANGATATTGALPGENQSGIGVGYTTSFGYHIIWTTQPGGPGAAIWEYAQDFNTDGTARTAVAAAPAGGGFPAYADVRVGSTEFSVHDNQAQFGELAPVTLPGEPASAVTQAAAVGLADGVSAVVAWADSGTDYVSIYDSATNSFGQRIGLDWGGVQALHLVALPDGGFVVSWQDTNGGAYKGEVFAADGTGGGIIALTGNVTGIDSHGDLYTVGNANWGPSGGPGGYVVQTYAINGGSSGGGGGTTGQTFTSDNNGDVWVGTAGNDTFNLGRGGDWVTGNGGNDTYKFAGIPWAGGHITDFNAGDVLDLTGLMSTTSDTGTDGFADGYLKITDDGTGAAQVWANYHVTGNDGWWLVETLDGVAPSSLAHSGDVITVGASSGGGGGGPTTVSTADAHYVAPANVTSIALTGSQQTIDASATSGVTITSNDTGNALIGGAGDDVFHLGRGGDWAAGGAGADTFAYAGTPWAGGGITDFNATEGDKVDVSGLLAASGYAGSDPFADGYLQLTSDSSGNAQLWSDVHQAGNDGWWLVATLDGVSTSSLHYSGGLIT